MESLTFRVYTLQQKENIEAKKEVRGKKLLRVLAVQHGEVKEIMSRTKALKRERFRKKWRKLDINWTVIYGNPSK